MRRPFPPVLVLAAGFGTRLAPLTEVRAKPAVPVAGVPLVARLLRWLGRQRVPFVVVNLHHRPGTITRVLGHGDTVGVPVRYSWETRLLGSAGGPRRARSLLGSRFFVVNGDTLVDVDLPELLEAHEHHRSLVTLAVADHPDPRRYGGVLVEEPARVTGFTRPGRVSQHFLGVQVVEARIFDAVPADTPAATIGGLYDELLRQDPTSIAAHRTSGGFLDVGTPGDYLDAALAVSQAEGQASIPVGERCRIHPTAVLTRTVVWDDVVIGPGCRLSDCILADGVELPAGTVADRTIVVATSSGLRQVPLHHGPPPPADPVS